ncbi:MAG TPA: biotin--[acetyl-CoA-carboxylase] ligase [Actinomycetota bacterium]|nr:biotin--[acetyl-CoA-carboxylase] ligase [Actinomycetota bacterium]
MSHDPLDHDAIAGSVTGTFGRILRVHDEIGSTNQDALEWAENDAPEGAVVTTEHQSAGRGRWGRSWSSAPGALLQFSVILRPALAPADAGLLTCAMGVGVARAVNRATELDARLKWPNDVMLSGRKTAGILVESRGRELVDVAVVGIGINVNWARSEMPADIASSATSLSEELGSRVDRNELLVACLTALEETYGLLRDDDGRARVIADATRLSDVLGHRVTVSFVDSSTREGVAERISDRGALILETPNGTEEVSVGEVTRVRPA